MGLLIAVLVVLLALSAFFSSSETALFSLSLVQVERLRERGGRTGRAVAQLLSLPRRLLITILVGNMVVNIALSSALAAVAAGSRLGHKAVAIAIVVTTMLLLIFGEVTPKTLAVRHAEGLSRAVAVPLLWFCQVILPIRFVLRHITNALLLALRRGRIESDALLTRREIAAAVEVGEEAGAIDEHEHDMLGRIFAFRQMDARELMVPRTEMVSVSEQMTVGEALEVARQSGHSRFPVHSGDPDDVYGLLDVRDLIASRRRGILGKPVAEVAAEGEPDAQPSPRPLVRPAFLVPETRHVGDLLRDMRERGAHMAILVDEHGGTAGLVTLRQLVEELVGGVLTRGREGEPLFRKGEACILVLGEARLRDVNHELRLALPIGRSDTMSGYVVELFGHIPGRGDEATDERFTYHVIRVAGRRVGAVEIRPRDPTDEGWRRLWHEMQEGEPC